MGERTCTRCKTTKPVAEFSLVYGRPRPRCKACMSIERRERYIRLGGIKQVRQYNLARYGLTPDDYDRMYAEQDGCCAICRQPERKIMHGKVTALAVDHDHQTGSVRQLLCASCNTVVGHLETNPVDPHLFVAYLDRHRKA